MWWEAVTGKTPAFTPSELSVLNKASHTPVPRRLARRARKQWNPGLEQVIYVNCSNCWGASSSHEVHTN